MVALSTFVLINVKSFAVAPQNTQSWALPFEVDVTATALLVPNRSFAVDCEIERESQFTQEPVVAPAIDEAMVEGTAFCSGPRLVPLFTTA